MGKGKLLLYLGEQNVILERKEEGQIYHIFGKYTLPEQMTKKMIPKPFPPPPKLKFCQKSKNNGPGNNLFFICDI